MTPSRQFAFHQQKSLERIRRLILPEARIGVTYDMDAKCFAVFHNVTRDTLLTGRFQVVHSFVVGYMRGWVDNSWYEETSTGTLAP